MQSLCANAVNQEEVSTLNWGPALMHEVQHESQDARTFCDTLQ
jgi:hypothetical protein